MDISNCRLGRCDLDRCDLGRRNPGRSDATSADVTHAEATSADATSADATSADATSADACSSCKVDSTQTLMRCAALLASHPCHPSPPPEPFLSPGAGDSSAHGRHLGLKMAFRLPVAAQAGLRRPEARRRPDFKHNLRELDSAASLAASVMF